MVLSYDCGRSASLRFKFECEHADPRGSDHLCDKLTANMEDTGYQLCAQLLVPCL